MKNLLCIGLLFLSFCPLWGQKVLQLERANKPRTIRMREGDPILFRLKGSDSVWEEGEITSLVVDRQAIIMGRERIPIADIAAIKLPKSRFVRISGANLIVFGLSWPAFGVLGEVVYNDDIDWTTAAIITGTTVPVGYWLTRPRKIRLTERRRLRILDLTIYPAQIPENR